MDTTATTRPVSRPPARASQKGTGPGHASAIVESADLLISQTTSPPPRQDPRLLAELVDLRGAEETDFFALCTFQGLVEGDPCSATGDWGNIGHYAQLVWKDTTEVGCGFAQDSETGNDILVARYFPPGNIKRRNVY